MPYETISGNYEKASRLSHSTAAVRAIADQRSFFVPGEAVRNMEPIKERVRPRSDTKLPDDANRLEVALAVDGSYVVEPVRDGLPSVMYGFAQVAAAYVDLAVMETQRAEVFVDPHAIQEAVNTALLTVDLPAAGAYTRENVDIVTSWREALYQVFRTKSVEFNDVDKPLLELLFILKGEPGKPATTLPVNCPNPECNTKEIPVPSFGGDCPKCETKLYPTDSLRIYEAVTEDGDNKSAMGRLMSVLELLVLVGLATFLWERARKTVLPRTLFIVDGPLAVFGESAKLRAWALDYFQAMAANSPGGAPYIVGIEKSSAMVDFAGQLVKHEVLAPGDLLVCDQEVLSRIANTNNVAAYGKETYWGRKFIYRALDGRVVVISVLPPKGEPYSSSGGMPDPSNYPALPAILDVIDRTGSSMYLNGIIPVAAAHGRAAFPIGVGTDVLRLVAMKRLGLGGDIVE